VVDLELKGRKSERGKERGVRKNEREKARKRQGEKEREMLGAQGRRTASQRRRGKSLLPPLPSPLSRISL
jgi:LmbE family N-acetylglucosaminyl deacetylase